LIDPYEIVNEQYVISGADARHVRTVLRMKPGDRIGLFDGNGMEYDACILEAVPGLVRVKIVGRGMTGRESPLTVTVAQALLKDKKMDALVRQLTELGATRWHPFTSSRSVARPDAARLSNRRQRWEKIARESIKQCRRGRLMDIGSVLSFDDVLELGSRSDLSLVFWEDESKPIHSLLTRKGKTVTSVLIMLGPEGGFSAEEIDKATRKGFVSLSLGPRILRAETATVAACALIQYVFGDLGPGVAGCAS